MKFFQFQIDNRLYKSKEEPKYTKKIKKSVEKADGYLWYIIDDFTNTVDYYIYTP